MFSAFTLGPLGIGFGFLSFVLAIVLVFIFYVLAATSLRKSFNALHRSQANTCLKQREHSYS
jgi:membrane protein implicated in regulation of membrane protease activity